MMNFHKSFPSAPVVEVENLNHKISIAHLITIQNIKIKFTAVPRNIKLSQKINV